MLQKIKFKLDRMGGTFMYPYGNRFMILSYIKDEKIIGLILEVKSKCFMTCEEMFRLCEITKAVKNIEGDIAEVGVYMGGSAKLISKYKYNKKLYLFDTFNGLPSCEDIDRESGFVEGYYNCSLEDVKNYLWGEKNIWFHKGIFPESAEIIKDKKFCLVHLDIDIYRYTKEALKFFYPRITCGGILVCHDYSKAIGIRKAFKEFFKDKPEIPFMISANQVMIIKR